MFRGGRGAGSFAECDLTERKARKRFEELKQDARCGWAELVAEDEDEGGYMEVIDEHEQIRLAQIISTLV